MKIPIASFAMAVSMICTAQHEHKTAESAGKWEFTPVFNHAFTDSGFAGKDVQLAIFTVPAGALDTVAHTHDCELIGYILEGEVITKMKNKSPMHLKTGDVFYEYPNEVHESLENALKDTDAKILLYYLYNKGATLYKKLAE
jgi:quercetin dioxygenase-like cupin family protein